MSIQGFSPGRRGYTLWLVASNLFMPWAEASPPTWWAQGNPPVIDSNAVQNNHGPANVGQAKWMAKLALANLRTAAPFIADGVERDLVGDGKAIATWDLPADSQEQQNQYRPLAIGQLKAISGPFYDHLQNAVPGWLSNERALNNMPDTGSYLPWTTNSADDANLAPATIGQLKAVYSLRFDSLAAAVNLDSDSDGLPDGWERYYFGSLNQSGSGDPDDDGLSNAEESNLHSNPADGDTDGDGMGDGYEVYYDLQVNSPVNMPSPPETEYVEGPGPDNDQDDDEKTNKEEWEGGGIPTSDCEEPKFIPGPPRRLKWYGVKGRVYFVERSTNLVTWQTTSVELFGRNVEIVVKTQDLFGPTEPPSAFFRVKKIYSASLDTDDDGIPDWYEIEKLGSNPNEPSSPGGDTDGDGIPDLWELNHGLDPNDPSDGIGDFDGDGMSNYDEFLAGTDPRLVDTDGDGIADGDDIIPRIREATDTLITNVLRILTPSRP